MVKNLFRLRHLHLRLLIFLMAFSLALTLGCGGKAPVAGAPVSSQDSLKTVVWKTLMTDKQVYDATFKTLALLDQQGKLPAKTKAQAISLGNKYLAAHNLAVQVLLDNGNPSLGTVKAAFDAFLAFTAPIAAGVN